MKKRRILLLLALAACVALLSVTAFAADDYHLTVCGTAVTSDNAADVLGDGKVSFNPNGRILTLNGATLSYNGNYGIYDWDGLTINLVGENTLTVTDAFVGIHARSGLTIQGNGSLSINCFPKRDSFDYASSIITGDIQESGSSGVKANLTIQGGARVTVTTSDYHRTVGGTYLYGVYCSQKMTVTGANTSLTVTTGACDIGSFSSNVNTRGIYAESMEVTAGAAVSAASGNAISGRDDGTKTSFGIQTKDGLTLENATLTVAHGTGKDTKGISGSVTSNGGNTLCASASDTLQQVLNAAKADGTDTVKLVGNVHTTQSLTVSQKVTLDLNGYRLIRTKGNEETETGDALAVSGEGDLTVKSSTPGGKIDGPQTTTGEKLKVEQSVTVAGSHTHFYESMSDLTCDCGAKCEGVNGKHSILPLTSYGKCDICEYQFPVVLMAPSSGMLVVGSTLESVCGSDVSELYSRQITLYADVTETAADTALELKNTSTSKDLSATLNLNGHTLDLNGRTMKVSSSSSKGTYLSVQNGTLNGQILADTRASVTLQDGVTLEAPNANTPAIKLDASAEFTNTPLILSAPATIKGGIDATGTDWKIHEFLKNSMLVGSDNTPVRAAGMKTLPHGTYTVQNHTAHTYENAICAICGTPKVITIVEANATAFWTNFDTNYANNTLTITSKEELRAFAMKVANGVDFSGKTVKLANDIDLTGYIWAPIGKIVGDMQFVFRGTFDGGCHTIKGLTVNTAYNDESNGYVNYGYAGLFAATQGATIKNLRVEGSVSGTMANNINYTGGLVGEATRSTLENCAFVGTVTSYVEKNDQGIGGVVGYFNLSNMNRCYANATVTQTGTVTTRRIGALVGLHQGGGQVSLINDCYWLQTTGVSGVGFSNRDAVDPINSAGKSAEAFASGEVAYLLNRGLTTPVWQQKLGTDTSPTFAGGMVRRVTFKDGETDVGYGYANAGGKLSKPTDPTKTGWRLAGWCRESTLVNAWDFTTDTVSADMTLYAKWAHAAHENGTATCSAQAICSVCNEPYGSTDPNNHTDIQHVARVESDIGKSGNIEYWYCTGCEKYFSDAALTKEITKQQTVLSAKSGTYSTSVSPTSNGSVSLTPSTAVASTQVTLTVTPDDGYELGSLSVTDQNGREVDLTKEGNGVYTFRMPEGGVSVRAKFVKKQSASFIDVPKGSYYEAAVQWAVANGITSGTDENHFDPSGSCTRAQLVTFLWRAAGCPLVEDELLFNDVSRRDYFAEAVRWAASEGIVKGYDESTFGANDTVTREQVATILFRFAAAQGMQAVTLQERLAGYSDAANVSTYAVSAMNWAVVAGVVQGANGSLLPQSDCTRAQIVTMLYRLLG